MGKDQLKVDSRGLEQRSLRKMEFPFTAGIARVSEYTDRRFCHHWHEDPEFTVILEGEMFYQVNDRILHLKAGQGVFVNSNMLHSGWNETDECVYIPLNFYPTILYGESNRRMKEKYVDPIIKSQNLPYLVFDPSKSEAQERIISALSEAHILYKEKKELHEIKIQRLLLEIWELMLPEALEAIRAETDDSAVKSVVRVKKAIDYIEANFAEHITLDELARACGLSRSEFCRCFKRIMNDTPMEYLNKTRIRKSLPLLLSRDYSVTQTAMLSGFSGSSYFSECFRKYMFCSPLEYVKNAKNDK
jgi:AraC-like DNA-binding protein